MKFNPASVSGEQFAAMLEINVTGNSATVKFPNGQKAKGSAKAWSEDHYQASKTLIEAAGGFFNLVACGRAEILAAINN